MNFLRTVDGLQEILQMQNGFGIKRPAKQRATTHSGGMISQLWIEETYEILYESRYYVILG